MQEKAPACVHRPVLLCCLPAQSRVIYCGLSRGSGLLPPVEDLPDGEHILRHSELHLPAVFSLTPEGKELISAITCEQVEISPLLQKLLE